MKALAHPFQAGDKIRLKKPQANWPDSKLYSATPQAGVVYCVRKTYFAKQNVPAVLLLGISSILHRPGGGEYGFAAELFERVGRGEACPLPEDPDGMVQLEIPMTEASSFALLYVHASDWITSQCFLVDDRQRAELLRRWEKRSPGTGIGLSYRESARRVRQAVAAGDRFTVRISISALAHMDLQSIAADLGIEPEELLQGLLWQLAGRVERTLRFYGLPLRLDKGPRP